MGVVSTDVCKPSCWSVTWILGSFGESGGKYWGSPILQGKPGGSCPPGASFLSSEAFWPFCALQGRKLSQWWPKLGWHRAYADAPSLLLLHARLYHGETFSIFSLPAHLEGIHSSPCFHILAVFIQPDVSSPWSHAVIKSHWP